MEQFNIPVHPWIVSIPASRNKVAAESGSP
jgi:hypothetical protein